MTKFKFGVAGIICVLAAGMFFAKFGWACTAWRTHDSDCIYGDMQDGTSWKRSCPNTVCHHVGRHRITNIPCSNETICMPSSEMDGPVDPTTNEVLTVHTNPNNLTGVCQKWYPITSDNSQMDGCADNQIIWNRVCQEYDPVEYPTRSCFAGDPNDTNY